MIFEHVSGCTCDSLNVDGRETIEMTNDELRGYLHKLIDEIDDIADLQSVLIHIIETIGTFECDGQLCECCGDCICTSTYELKE